MEKKDTVKKIMIYGLMLSTVFIIFFTIMVKNFDSDFNAHIRFAQEFLKGKGLPPNFLYYFLVVLIAGFKNNLLNLQIASSVLLSFAIMAKFFITKSYYKENIKSIQSEAVFISLSVAALLSFAIPSIDLFYQKSFYLGTFPPNVWHNSTP